MEIVGGSWPSTSSEIGSLHAGSVSFAPAGTYTIETHDADPRGARQLTAAQYKMLAAL
jgi:hypothetical protein